MNYTDKILGMSNKVNFTSLQQYLMLRGWQKQTTKREDVVVMVSPNNDPKLDILLPLSRDFVDYPKAIFESIRKISIFENREEVQLINDLVVPPADIIRYKVDNEQTSVGLISLKAGFELLESARKSLLSAASDIIAPTLFHQRMSYKPAMQFIDSCFMGQTERGSYIASIICPFIKTTNEEQPVQLTLFSSEETLQTSFTRTVTKKLMHSIDKLKRGIESGNIDSLIDPEMADKISANFLESLIEMNEFTQNSKIVITTTWAPTIPIPQDIPSSIEITNDYIEPIKSIIDRIKPEIIEISGEYVGKISQVKANPDVKNRADGEVTFIFISNEQKAITAKVTLEGDDLHSAIKAFDEGKNVKIVGNLKIQSRQRVIESPIFKVIE